MSEYKKDHGLGGLTTRALRARRTRLARVLPDPGQFVAGSLVEQHRKCGKEGCRCTRGQLHGPYVYLSVAGHLVYVPAGLAQAVRDRLDVSARLQALLEEISAINLELLSRKELD
jgi:Family of unknown function (DUF6788)